MKKLQKSGNLSVDIQTILESLQSGDVIECLFAIKYCAINSISDEKVLDTLQKLSRSDRFDMGCKVSDAAEAALVMIQENDYNGENRAVIELIKNRFYEVRT